ncbi:hypothetical protein [Paenibacillus xylanexedens]|nr:hypothetical protein [Paenibacillus xylanexedens]
MVTDGEEKEICIGLCGTGDDGSLAKKLTDAGQEGVIELTLTWTES